MDDLPPELAASEPLDHVSASSADGPLVEEASTEYLGRWNRLVSTTNWEKGRIIYQWRLALLQAEASPGSCSDEAWSRRVGNITPQHVGRLRRVYQRFGTVYEQYDGLYWSHFQAAIDWDDAEMYLQGAVQEKWSVSQMRGQRWEAMGAPPEKKPRDEDVITGELNEDVDLAHDEGLPDSICDSPGVVRDAEVALEDESQSGPYEATDTSVSGDGGPSVDDRPVDPVRPFENLPALPPDLNEAFEGFKLAVLSHKVSGWQEISLNDVLAVLDALKALALAPADG